jgi:hypothetical protein
LDVDAWKTAQNGALNNDPALQMEIGYIGGGNAFLIFRTEELAKEFIQAYSKQVLLHFPGLRTANGLQNGFNYQTGKAFTDHMEALHENLMLNRTKSTSIVSPFKHGIADDCAWSNEAQEIKVQTSDNTQPYISQLSNSRIQAVEASKQDLHKKYKDLLQDKYTFTDELDKLGQPDDKGYIAIIHADGNGMGKKFKECQNLKELRNLSIEVAELAKRVMNKMISYVVGWVQFHDDLKLAKDEKSKLEYLPIRPLIAGGDDITIICEGRLGVHLTEKLLEFMTAEKVGGDSLSACAGVAIVHTKYPFYRAYHLAEELMASAKSASRAKNDSWFNFMISSGGFSGSYQDIVESQYTLLDGKKLKWGPYRIDRNQGSFEALIVALKQLQKDWPKNKVRELRDVLKRGEASEKYFIEHMKARGLDLPNLSGFGLKKNEFWVTMKNPKNDDEEVFKTPFIDLIELLDFYPNTAK